LLISHSITSPIKQVTSGEAKSSLASQGIFSILQNVKLQSRTKYSSLLILILSKVHIIHNFISCSFIVSYIIIWLPAIRSMERFLPFIITLVRTSYYSYIFLSRYPKKLSITNRNLTAIFDQKETISSTETD
jgi:hypothetical protein